MPRTPKKPAEKLAPVADAILDQFGPAAGMSMAEIDAATRRLKRALVERMLGGERSHHLGYPPGGLKPEETPNHRHGTRPKTVRTDDGPVALDVPRDRAGTFEPILVPKHAGRWPGFDDKVLALYARGLPMRESQHYLQEIYAFTDLKTRGCEDILIAVTDGLKGMPEALEAVYPQTTLHTCIGHLIRRSLDFAGYQDRRALAAALRPIYTAPSAEAAAHALDALADGPWGARFPMVVKGWRTAWAQVVPFFAFPPDVRRVIYTTNALESVHAGIRRIIKARGHFPSDEAATKLIWLALRNLCSTWTAPAQRWKPALHAFAVAYGDRFLRRAI